MLLRLRKHPSSLYLGRAMHPLVTVNGRTHQLPWGDNHLSVPDDIPVELMIHVPNTDTRSFRRTIGAVAYTVPPGPGRAVEYTAPAFGSAPGEVGPLGTTRAHGVRRKVAFLAVLGFLTVIVLLGVLSVIWAGATGQL